MLAGIRVGTETAADAKLTYRHDVLGRRIRETEPNTDYSTFTWNELSQLKWATFRTRTGTYSRRDFAYGPTGLRQSVTRDGVVKLEAWEEALGSNAPMLTQGLDAVVYGPGGMLLERVGANGSNPRYQWQDAIGTVIGGTSSSGATTRLSYDAWGRRVSGNDTLVGSQGFAGQVMESETDYSYMRARWYDAQTGLFLTVDPKVDETRQPYLYAGGNPAQYTDPSGESFGEDFANGMIQGLSNGLIKPGSNEGSCSWSYFMGLQAGENFNPLGKAKKLEELLGFAKIGKHSLGVSNDIARPFSWGDSSQFGKKIGQHAGDWGLDATKETDRARLREIIEGIAGGYDRAVLGEFRGQGQGGGIGPAVFRIKGNDVVVTKPDGTFVTVLKDGINNRLVQNALRGK